MYRPEYYGITTDDEGRSTQNIAEVIVGKQRNGPVGSVPLHFVKEYARFENLTSATYDDYSGGSNFDLLVPDDEQHYSSSSKKKPNPAKGLGPIIEDDSPF